MKSYTSQLSDEFYFLVATKTEGKIFRIPMKAAEMKFTQQ